MRANVVIFSYNRPRMLREAIISVLWNSTHKDVLCWVIDDGSDFDATELLEEFKDDRLAVIVGEKPTLEQRVNDGTRFPRNVNSIIEQFDSNEFVVYLCDDDVIGHKYLEFSSNVFELNPHIHLTSGDAYYFYDGENPYVCGKEGFKYPPQMKDSIKKQRTDLMFWHVGNFSNRTECNLEEGLRWKERNGDAHSWDVDYIQDLNDLHRTNLVYKMPALYRREHENMLSHRLGRLNGDPMLEDTYYVFEPKELTEDMVTGMME